MAACSEELVVEAEQVGALCAAVRRQCKPRHNAHAGFLGCRAKGWRRKRVCAQTAEWLCRAQLTPGQKQGKPPPVADRAAYAGIDNVQARARNPRLPAALPGRLCMSAHAASATCWQWPPRLMPSGMGPAAGRQRQLPDQDWQHNRRVHHHGARPCSLMQPRAPCLSQAPKQAAKIDFFH